MEINAEMKEYYRNALDQGMELIKSYDN